MKLTSLTLAMLALSGSRPASIQRHPAITHAGYAAQLFGAGTISTRDFERDGTFTRDGRTFYFTKRTMWPYFSAICVSRLEHGHWSTPAVASFSGRWADATPFIAPDGSAIFFASRRPVPNGSPGYHLWTAARSETGFGEPHPLPDVVNSAGNELSPAITSSGSLYFIGGPFSKVLRAQRDGATWHAPVVVSTDTTGASADVGVFVDPSERFMIVSILGRDDALHSAEGLYPRSDLYLRERAGDNWTTERHLPTPINSAANEGGQPTITPDGKYLVFTSERGHFTEHGKQLTFTTLEQQLRASGNGLGDLYMIDVRALGLTR